MTDTPRQRGKVWPVKIAGYLDASPQWLAAMGVLSPEEVGWEPSTADEVDEAQA